MSTSPSSSVSPAPLKRRSSSNLRPSRTLIITGLNSDDFTLPDNNNNTFVSILEQKLRATPSNTNTETNNTQQCLTINHWAPLKSFKRIIAVFDSISEAIYAKDIIASYPHESGSLKASYSLEAGMSSSYFESPKKRHLTINTNIVSAPATTANPATAAAANTPPDSAKESNDCFSSPKGSKICDATGHLALPDPGKLFIISPPPSPPEGWESRYEEEPNKAPFHKDLGPDFSDLLFKKLGENIEPHEGTASPEPSTSTQLAPAATIVGPSDKQPSTPIIVLEDCGDDNDVFRPVIAEQMKRFRATAAPPRN